MALRGSRKTDSGYNRTTINYKRVRRTPKSRRKYTLTLKQIQEFNHPIVCCAKQQFFVNTTTGFRATFASATTSPNLQFSFGVLGPLYRLGSNTSQTLTAFANGPSLTNVFDQYRLKKVVCSFCFSNNSSALQNANHVIPTIYAVTDKDESEPLGNSQIAMAYSDCKITQLGNTRGTGMQYITCYKPAVEVEAVNSFGSGAAVGSLLQEYKWMDTADTTVVMNGIKFYIESPGSQASVDTGVVEFFFRCYFEYKHTH